MKKIVLAIVFALMAASFAAADTVYLRDGRAVRGTVLGYIGGRFAVRLTERYETTERRQTNEVGEIVFFRPREIDRIEIDGRSLEEARYRTRRVEVTLAPNWVDSGVDVRRGDRVQVSASGTIVAGRTRITPDGLRTTDPYAPSPRSAEGVLIGAISNDANAPVIEIGSNREFVADRDGRLYLTPNRSSYTDARGAFDVQVRTELDFRQRNTTARRTGDEETDDYDPFGTSVESSNPAPARRRVQGSRVPQTSDDPPPPATLEKIIVVPGTSRGTDTGLELRAGDQVTITATGTVVAGQRAGSVTPDGGRVGVISAYPVPSVGVGALIGYIRTADGQAGTPFVIGSGNSFTPETDGRLFLLINDDNYRDNSGSFNVRIVYMDREM
ncbi:MAG: hypothetical protein H7Y30_14690 [Pyrinomonadaceae bacterium]|nr:hypothetical protein [Pyrinomonadaceae bacterium]